MTSLHPYLNFDGKTEQAMKFYAEALGGKLEIMRFGDSPMPSTPEQKNLVMHAALEFQGMRLMASDKQPQQKLVEGNNVHLSLNFTDKVEQKKIWDRLTPGATVTMPLTETFFGIFGMLTDKFGINWMLHVNTAPSR